MLSQGVGDNLVSGYQMHIPKPVEPTELTSVVVSLAERYTKPVAI
jgi:hypothetical protein